MTDHHMVNKLNKALAGGKVKPVGIKDLTKYKIELEPEELEGFEPESAEV